MADEQQHTPEQLREFELRDLRSQAQFYAETEAFLSARADDEIRDARRGGDGMGDYARLQRDTAVLIAPIMLAACACAAEARALRSEIAALEAGGGTDG